MPPGPDNPLGAYMMTLGWPSYLVHGTNKPYGVGMRSSHGCIRFYPEDIEQLYDNIPVGTKVTVVNQPFVFGWHEGALYVQAFPIAEDDEREHPAGADTLLNAAISDEMWQTVKQHNVAIDLPLVTSIATDSRGIAVPVSRTTLRQDPHAKTSRKKSVAVPATSFSMEQYLTAARHVENKLPEGSNWNGKDELLVSSAEFEATRNGIILPEESQPKKTPIAKPATRTPAKRSASGSTVAAGQAADRKLAVSCRGSAKGALPTSPSSRRHPTAIRFAFSRGGRCMRILMISDVYFPRINGVSTSIQTFRRGLTAAGHETILVAPEYQTEWPGADEGEIIRVPARDLPRDPEDRAMKIGSLRELRPMLSDRHLDIVHIQTPFIAHYHGVSLARRFGVPVVETYHTYFEEYLHHYVPLMPRALTRFLARRFTTSQCNALDALVVPSRAMQNALEAYGVQCTDAGHSRPAWRWSALPAATVHASARSWA